jgi:hypothetical protein
MAQSVSAAIRAYTSADPLGEDAAVVVIAAGLLELLVEE